jgi:DNA-binding XRE family transcriptional regulator
MKATTNKKQTKKPKIKIKENKIKAFLQKANITQQELADTVGTNRGHISKIVNQKSPAISVAMAMRIAKILKTTVEQLFIAENE